MSAGRLREAAEEAVRNAPPLDPGQQSALAHLWAGARLGPSAAEALLREHARRAMSDRARPQGAA